MLEFRHVSLVLILLINYLLEPNKNGTRPTVPGKRSAIRKKFIIPGHQLNTHNHLGL